MQELKNFFEYEFKGQLKYIRTGKGEEVIAKKISIKAPSYNNTKDATVIEQEYKRGLLNLTKLQNNLSEEDKEELRKIKNKATSKKNEKETMPEDFIFILMSSNADMDKCFRALENIILSNYSNKPTAYIDDTEVLTETIYKDFMFADIKNILGEYIKNFLNTSQGN